MLVSGAQNYTKISQKVCEACNLCASSGMPHFTKKTSTTHVLDDFNNVMQCNFVTERIQTQSYEVLNITDLSTTYEQGRSTPRKDA